MTAPVPQTHPYGFAVSDKIKHEVHKQDVWSIFSPAGGYVPKVALIPAGDVLLSHGNFWQDSINLGQGFMNWGPRRHPPPEYWKNSLLRRGLSAKYVQEAAQEAISNVDANHYSVPKGRLRLRSALAKHYCR
jgi:kynurenine aminotransferase